MTLIPFRPARLLVGTLTCSLLAQQNPGAPCQMNNSTVVELLRAGLAPTAVIERIAVCDPHYGLLPGDTDAMLKAGVPESVIKAMAARANGQPIPASSGRPVPARPVSDEPRPQALDPVGAGSDAVNASTISRAPVNATTAVSPGAVAGNNRDMGLRILEDPLRSRAERI
jgi:hypothetical protein